MQALLPRAPWLRTLSEAWAPRCAASLATVPVIDFACFSGGSPARRAEVSAELFAAFGDIGFATVVNHEISPALTAAAFDASRSFFELPRATKEAYRWASPESNRGYLAVGQERADGLVPDTKETFEIGSEAEEAFPNLWPHRELPHLRETMLAYFQAADALHLDVLRCIAIGMGLPEEYFTPLCNGNHQNLRLLHYPSCPRAGPSGEGSSRIGAHTDYGSITLLAQDPVGGLQARAPNGAWVSVPPVPGGIVVNIGDLLMRWSNGTLRSTEHRVLAPPGAPERFSIAFFCNPNKESLVECLPGCASAGSPPRYVPINAFEYLTGRLRGTISAD